MTATIEKPAAKKSPAKASKPAKKSPAKKKKAAKPAKASGKPAKATKPKAGKPDRMGCLSAAVAVLVASSVPMTCQQIIDEAAAKGLWTTPGGKTPAATLRAAMSREIKEKGNESRFAKADRGLFRLA